MSNSEKQLDNNKTTKKNPSSSNNYKKYTYYKMKEALKSLSLVSKFPFYDRIETQHYPTP
jgi:hypothetical protein